MDPIVSELAGRISASTLLLLFLLYRVDAFKGFRFRDEAEKKSNAIHFCFVSFNYLALTCENIYILEKVLFDDCVKYPLLVTFFVISVFYKCSIKGPIATSQWENKTGKRK